MVRPGQRHVQEAHPRRSPGAVCRRTLQLKPLPAWVPEVVPAASAPGGHRRIRLRTNQSVLGASFMDRAPGRGARNQETRSRSSSMRRQPGRAPASRRSRTQQDHPARTPASAWPGNQENRSSSGGKGHRRAAPEIAGYVTALKQHSRKLVVLALRQLLRMVREYPARRAPGGRRRSRPLRPLRPGSTRTHDSAPHRPRVLPAQP